MSTAAKERCAHDHVHDIVNVIDKPPHGTFLVCELIVCA